MATPSRERSRALRGCAVLATTDHRSYARAMLKLRNVAAAVFATVAVFVGATTVSTTVTGCVPGPRYERCSNGGECSAKDPKYEYCLNGRCVECVARGSCGAHRACKNGECVESSQ